MSPGSRRAKLAAFVLLVLLHEAVCHRCYICGPLQNGFTRECGDFNYLNQKTFIEDCKSAHGGCSTQYQGDVITRQCEDIQLNDCKIANDIKYCYCATDLCNSLHMDSGVPLDDEDMVDGSGNVGNPIEETNNNDNNNSIIPVVIKSDASVAQSTVALFTLCILLY